MATRRTAKPGQNSDAQSTDAAPETADTGTGSAPLALPELRKSEGVKRAERPKEANPFVDYVRASLENGALAVDAADKATADKYTSLLRRAATELNVGLNQSTTVNANGTFTIDFEANTKKRERKYTNADIVAWYADTFRTDAGPAELSGPISPEIRKAFKVANKYDKGRVSHLDREFVNE